MIDWPRYRKVARPFQVDMRMTKREIGMMLAGVLLFGGLSLWGAIYAIDHYAFGEDAREIILHRR